MTYRLDDIDLKILNILQTDPRLSNKELAAKLNRSPNPVLVRVKRLEDEGYITRYTAIINPKMIGKGLAVYTQVKLKQHSQEILEKFMGAAAALPEVMECYHMTGDFDFFLKIAIKNMDEYNTLLMKQLSNLPEVGTLESLFVMSEVKNTNMFNLKEQPVEG